MLCSMAYFLAYRQEAGVSQLMEAQVCIQPLTLTELRGSHDHRLGSLMRLQEELL